MKKISVIVPIYNAEKYLEKCIESIMSQTYKDIELILVNDGSTDNSEKIINKYVNSKDINVIYVKKENGGLSDARNFGLKYATGDYYAFIDSDDYIEKKTFEEMSKYMEEKYDMIKMKIKKVNEEGKVLEENFSPTFTNKTGEEAFDILCWQDKMTEVAWGYIYRAKFWKDNKFEYAKGLYHEDFGLTPLIMLNAKKVASTNIYGYNYVQTANSMVRDNKEKAFIRAKDLLKHYDNMIKVINDYDITKKSKENIKQYYTNSIILAIDNLNTNKEKEEYINDIKERGMIKNIKVKNFRQAMKKFLLIINMKLYLRLKKWTKEKGNNND